MSSATFDRDDCITADNVEDELKKLKIIEDYDSDEYEHDRICLTGTGVDINALKAGKDVEFSVETDEKSYDFEDRQSEPIDYEKLYRYRNMEVIGGFDDENTNGPTDSKTPFEVLKSKMIDITKEQNGGVFKRILAPGYGQIIPLGSYVRVHYNGYFEMNDEPFDSTYLRNKSFQFKLGASEVVLGLDIGVATMKKKEKSQFIFAPEYYCGKLGCEPRVPKETPVLFEVEVISVLELNPLDEFQVSCEDERRKMPFSKTLQICYCLRELGNDNYARQNFRDSSHYYRKAIYLMENKSAADEEEDKKLNGILLKLYLNMSQVSLKQSRPKTCIYYCKAALLIDKDNTKALFRYGRALRLLQDFDRSRTYLMRALHSEPTNKEITIEIEKLNDMILKYNRLEKNMYKRMFEDKNSLNTTTTTTATITTDANNNDNDALKPADKTLNEQTKSYITKKLEEFVSDKYKTVYTIQADNYPQQMINFIITQSQSLNLSTRLIKASTNILQIMKEKSNNNS